jgi:uncharacterized membrane protein (DUF485 family)
VKGRFTHFYDGVPPRDKMFVWFVTVIFVVLLLYGAGMMAAILWGDHYNLARSLISGFAAMFSAWVGLGSGYILGRRTNDEGS